MSYEIVSLADRIERAMENHNLSPREFVEKIGYKNINKGLRWLDSWRSGESYPNKDQIDLLAKVLNGSTEALQQVVDLEKKTQSNSDQENHSGLRDYSLSIQVRKYINKTRTFPENYPLEEVLAESREYIDQLLDQFEGDTVEDGLAFLAKLNTPDHTTYRLNTEGEIVHAKEPLSKKLISFSVS